MNPLAVKVISSFIAFGFFCQNQNGSFVQNINSFHELVAYCNYFMIKPEVEDSLGGNRCEHLPRVSR